MAERDPAAPQRRAADPRVSAWVGANAGSGKTRVLTERVARLLLDGADPGRILCLTYTKAAAAEMQARLFALLGDWSMQPDATLGRMLGALSGEGPVRSAARLAAARRLFARALETPGGLKIQTIHAFCDALLRRFPLEAGLAPGFEVLDERRAALMLKEVRDRLAEKAERGCDPAFDGAAKRLNEGEIDKLIHAVLARRHGFREDVDVDALLRRHFGEAADRSPEDLAKDRLAPLEADVKRMAKAFATGSKTDAETADAFSNVLRLWRDDPLRAGERLIRATLVQSGDRKGLPRSGKPTKKLCAAHPGLDARFLEVAEAARALNADLAAHETAARARDLYGFAGALLEAYDAEKSERSLLDFDDLIARAEDLLSRSDMRAWVLYRLDRGIDHVLVDEAQDTAPAQWRVIQALTGDFYAGDSGRAADPRDGGGGLARSVFVVGDEKQSIYSFQGADPAEFDKKRREYAAHLEGVGERLERPDLITSFRSAPGILAFVDAVFGDERAREGVTSADAPVRHAAHRAGDPARVDLWPLVEPKEKPEEPHWTEPVDAPSPDHPKRRLAARLAAEIRRMIAEERLPGRNGGPSRPIAPGDILVLVRKRDELARSLIRNLKTLSVPVTGADRLTLAGELAVKDLLSLIKAVLNREDDLSLAEVLRSPLCAVGEDDLFALAHGREGTLWAALTASDAHEAERAMLNDLAACAGFLSPFEFLERALIRHDGRRRLIARLGPDAEDPIDETLAQALSFEAQRTPSLHEFVAWIEAGDIALKREMDKGAGEVRVMTVHGAKGLEAPVVVLPDTMGKTTDSRDPLLPTDGSLILWRSGAMAGEAEIVADARDRAEQRAAAEEKRLLYVGLTRAEDWLILAGAGRAREAPGRWYGMVETAFGLLDRDREVALPEIGGIRRIADGAWPEPETAADAKGTPPQTRPDWLAPPADEPRLRRIAPSDLAPGAASDGPPNDPPNGLSASPESPSRVAGRLDPVSARKRGEAVHLALERLPGADPAHWQTLAVRLIAETVPGLPPGLARAAAAEALAVLADPALAWMFAANTLGEVAVSHPLDLPGVPPMQGRIDRLAISETEVTVVDFKTDFLPPEREEDVPQRYLIQLGAYRAALARIYPNRTVRAGVLWTRTRRFAEPDPARLDAAWARAFQGIDSVGIAP